MGVIVGVAVAVGVMVGVSLAVVLFEMLTGDVPYRAESGLLVAAQHISAPVPDIRSRRPDLPPGLSAVMGRALAKRRDDRYPTGAALVADMPVSYTHLKGVRLIGGQKGYLEPKR